MHFKKFPITQTLSIAVVAIILLLPASMWASGSSERVIHTFSRKAGGYGPAPGLVADAAGNLYGAALGGGTSACGCGTVFELSPPASEGGPWTETVLYSFQGMKSGGTDGANPAVGVIFDRMGNLYGSTRFGGKSNSGTIFELSPPATEGEPWTENVLYSFPRDGKRGSGARGLLFGPDGNLYGLTLGGGASVNCSGGCGVAFVLVRPATAGGAWAQHILHEFGSFPGDSVNPFQFVFAPSGALYGIATSGGSGTKGTFFKLAKKHGSWTETILYNFSGNDGSDPTGIVFDQAGNVYGTAQYGGNGGCQCGIVFKLLPPTVPGGWWTEVTLYTLTGANDGSNPNSPLIFDKAGDLYGAAFFGGDPICGCGTVFQLTPPTVSGAEWTETTLHAFVGHDVHADGSEPFGGLTMVKGKLYGTTYNGGASRIGTAFGVAVAP